MRLQHLHLLLSIAQTGSLRASAEAMHVTQPALTKALKQLEEELGTTLVLRTPKGARLAPAGEALAARAAIIVRELDRAREDVNWHVHHAEATLNVGVSPAAAMILAPPAVARYQTRWPKVRVRLLDALYPVALTQLRSGELDLALGPLPAAALGRDLQARTLIDSPQVLAARAGHPLARTRRLADLRQAQWIITGPQHGPGDPATLGGELWQDAPARIGLECSSFSTLLALLPEVDAVALLPKRIFDAHAANAGLVALPIDEALPVTQIHAFVRTDVPLSVPAQRFLDAVEAQAQRMRGV
ncbi:LysR family transcriptional regulator [Achromobacter sp. GG226]|uniref:LysR family transcriptional regulator n=1 Tax=Verticiella alkaliphila TaxID=2779529 RepID=UPI001C0E2FAC|nr:LysR substrate-binding domain-containing protein [Verticiella sp. GG226]MBU4611774.1 LysR family transcriptional regulator [Verticiella sp. GG226]